MSKKNYIYKEITQDRGTRKYCTSSKGKEYILTSSYAKDMHHDFLCKHHKLPSDWWFRKHFDFTSIEIE